MTAAAMPEFMLAPELEDEPDLGDACDVDDAEVRTVAATLRALYASGSTCSLTARELAAFASCSVRYVFAANALIRATYGARFVEVAAHYKDTRGVLFVARRILPPAARKRDQGGVNHSRILSDTVVLVRLGDLQLRAIADTAAGPASKEVRHPSRKRTRERSRNRAPLAPLRLDAGVDQAIADVHGRAAWLQIRKILTEPAYHSDPAAARLAARTMMIRTSPVPPRLYRHLFALARRGELADEDTFQILETRNAEAAAAKSEAGFAAWPSEPDDEPAHVETAVQALDRHGLPAWIVHVPPPPEPPLVTREQRDRELAESRRALERLGDGLE